MKTLKVIILEHIQENSDIIARKRAAGTPKSEMWDWIAINTELREILEEFEGQRSHIQ